MKAKIRLSDRTDDEEIEALEAMLARLVGLSKEDRARMNDEQYVEHLFDVFFEQCVGTDESYVVLRHIREFLQGER